MKNRAITFLYHVPFWVQNGKVYAEHPAIGRFVEALACHASRVSVFCPEPSGLSSMSYLVRADNISVTHLPAYRSILQFWWSFPSYVRILWGASHDWDLLAIRMPTHAGFPAFLAALWHKKPVFQVVVGEGLAYSRLYNFPFPKQYLADLDARLQDAMMGLMASRCLTFTNGDDLYDKLNRPGRKVRKMRSSTIFQSDIASSRWDTCETGPYKILTVATISPRKGTSLIPEIMALLRRKGIALEWTYIGSVDGNAGEQEMRRTLTLAAQKGVLENLHFPGCLGWEALRSYYDRSDLFVLPTYMEGIPRVILEAQAAGLPVITTTVGGIPNAVRNEVDALLVAPGDPSLLADAIERLIREGCLRQMLIREGLESAKEATVENETHKMFDIIEEQLLRQTENMNQMDQNDSYIKAD